VNADAKHKLIRRYAVTDAAVHDSQPLDALLTKGNTSTDVFADSAYRSAEIEAKLKARGFNSRIHRRASRNHPLSNAQTRANRAKSRIRARIEHVFGAQESSVGGRIVRNDRHRAGARQNRLAEPRLQYSPPRDAGPDGRGMRRSLPAAPHGAGGQTKGSRLGDRLCSKSVLVPHRVVKHALNGS